MAEKKKVLFGNLNALKEQFNEKRTTENDPEKDVESDRSEEIAHLT